MINDVWKEFVNEWKEYWRRLNATKKGSEELEIKRNDRITDAKITFCKMKLLYHLRV